MMAAVTLAATTRGRQPRGRAMRERAPAIEGFLPATPATTTAAAAADRRRQVRGAGTSQRALSGGTLPNNKQRRPRAGRDDGGR